MYVANDTMKYSKFLLLYKIIIQVDSYQVFDGIFLYVYIFKLINNSAIVCSIKDNLQCNQMHCFTLKQVVLIVIAITLWLKTK